MRNALAAPARLSLEQHFHFQALSPWCLVINSQPQTSLIILLMCINHWEALCSTRFPRLRQSATIWTCLVLHAGPLPMLDAQLSQFAAKLFWAIIATFSLMEPVLVQPLGFDPRAFYPFDSATFEHQHQTVASCMCGFVWDLLWPEDVASIVEGIDLPYVTSCHTPAFWAKQQHRFYFAKALWVFLNLALMSFVLPWLGLPR